MAIIYNHIWHILLFSCIKTDRTKIYEESDIKTNTQTSLHSYPGFAEGLCSCQVWPHGRSLRLKRVPAYPVFRFFWSVSSTWIPCVSLLLKCFKYLNTLCFASFDLFQVPEYPVFRFFWSVSSTCIPCVSLLLMYSKYLYTLCFGDVVLFQVPV